MLAYTCVVLCSYSNKVVETTLNISEKICFDKSFEALYHKKWKRTKLLRSLTNPAQVAPKN